MAMKQVKSSMPIPLIKQIEEDAKQNGVSFSAMLYVIAHDYYKKKKRKTKSIYDDEQGMNRA